ncbi:MAG: D-aminoacyl-tRNA deacylase [Gammaproteobacteria bacterium]
MIALIQRVSDGQVVINNEKVANIDTGIVALLAVQSGDTTEKSKRLIERILNYRIFPDNADKMNLSLLDIHGGLILVPQFTLVADTRRGNRPSFGKNVSAEVGKQYFEQLIIHAKKEYNRVQNGVFGADMQVTLTNDGPVTFWLEV